MARATRFAAAVDMCQVAPPTGQWEMKMCDGVRSWPDAVWLWHKGVHVSRWRMDLATGRIVERRTVPADPHFRVTMAGHTKRCATVPVAVFTPDRKRLVVQRRRVRFDLSGPDVTTRQRVIGPVVVLTLRARGQRTLRVRDWIWSERLLDPMDDRFLDMIERLAHRTDSEIRWDPFAVPPPAVRA